MSAEDQPAAHPWLRRAFIPSSGSPRYFLGVGAAFIAVGVAFWIGSGELFPASTSFVLGVGHVITAGLVHRFPFRPPIPETPEEAATYDKTVLNEHVDP